MTLVKTGGMLLLVSIASLPAFAQCSNASLSGNYFYMLSGTIKSGTSTVSYSELGKLTADGNGNLTGQTSTSTAGAIATLSVTGTYTVHANCSGTVTLTTSVESVTFAIQVVDGGDLTLSSATASSLSLIVQGRFYRAANSTGNQCGTGTLSGTYGALLAGGTYAGGVRSPYENATQIVFDGNGNVTATGMVTTGSANGAAFSGTGTYSINADCSGTAQVSNVNGTLNYNLARIQGGTILFQESDANTTISGTADPELTEEVLPQFVFGSGWYTALYFTNLNSFSVSFTVTFTGDTGTSMTVPGTGASKHITLAPGGTAIIEGQNSGNLTEGYATFTLPPGVTGYGVFRLSLTGRADQEALVGFRTAESTSTTLTFDDINLTTSVAIVNTSAVSNTVNITLRDTNGNMIGTSQVAVAAGTKVAAALRTFPGLSGMAGLRGSALFTVSSGNVSVLALRFDAEAFTSIPTTQQ